MILSSLRFQIRFKGVKIFSGSNYLSEKIAAINNSIWITEFFKYIQFHFAKYSEYVQWGSQDILFLYYSSEM